MNVSVMCLFILFWYNRGELILREHAAGDGIVAAAEDGVADTITEEPEFMFTVVKRSKYF